MILSDVSDWTEAYSVLPYVPDGASFPRRWAASAAAFREALAAEGRSHLDIAYSDHDRQRLDIFLPTCAPKGLLVFVHGGFWKSFDKSSWSHLASGAIGRGLAVAIPSYRLCPEARISNIVQDVSAAITWAANAIKGPIYLAGHSAGGHLVTRMIASPSPLAPEVRARVVRCLSISGLHDLRPLIQAEMNTVLKLDEAVAVAHSPALLRPDGVVELIAWVGAAERPEFLRQNHIIASLWGGLGARTAAYAEPDRHHFDVIEGLSNQDSDMLSSLTRQV